MIFKNTVRKEKKNDGSFLILTARFTAVVRPAFGAAPGTPPPEPEPQGFRPGDLKKTDSPGRLGAEEPVQNAFSVFPLRSYIVQ